MIDHLLASASLCSVFTDEERAVMRGKLCALLESAAASYAGRHPQTCAAVREELLRSLLYALSLDPRNPYSFRPLLIELPEVRLENAQLNLRRKADCAARLAAGSLHLFPLPSQSARKTLKSISDTLTRYDPVFFSHQLDADYAYPLTTAPDTAKAGVDYALDYLIHLNAETSILRAFAPHRAIALLDGWRRDWRQADVNILSPLVHNAMALTLLSRDPKRLHIGADDREALLALLALKNKEQLKKTLLCVFPDIAKALGLDDPDEYALLMNEAKALAPRIYDACRSGDLSLVFPSFALPCQL